jgi:hypothetical protein
MKRLWSCLSVLALVANLGACATLPPPPAWLPSPSEQARDAVEHPGRYVP